MSKLYIIIFLLTIFILYVVVTGEINDNEPGDDENNDEESFEFESNETFNKTSKEKPERYKDRDTITINNDAGQTSSKGKQVRNHETNYPYTVSIQKKESHYASGALVDKTWILTAAAEFYNIRESIKVFRARLGSVNCKKGGTLVSLKKIEIHPLYAYRQPKFDLALIRIAQPLQFSEYIKPINLSKSKGQIVSAKFLVTYWPRLIINGKILPDTAKERFKQNSMRVSTENLMDWKKCKAVLQAYNYSIGASNLCLKPIQSHHSPCMPDAGAPVVADDDLWGITSGWASEDCISHPIPTIVTRTPLPLVQSWLDSLI